ncbi:lipocalin family protein [Thermus filiformis]|uniref:AttH protein n=1 Tax=Thermus filiformis TaxID=276 RepID=A0A0A2WRA6_THEFI|nr:lipocalin family protein [Thermus filiformis]KGQ22358.2 attH protein [Thermus filiformis]
MRPLYLLPLLLAACAPALLPFDPQRLPDPGDWDPRPAPLEWWYASGYAGRYAFHFAFFKAYPPRDYQVMGLPAALFFPGPFHAVHLALTDLKTGKRRFLEASDFPGGGARVGPGPDLELKGFRFFRQGRAFRLLAGPLDLDLYPLKPPVVHPPGYSGTEATGRMYYQSYTRVLAQGRVEGEEAYGEAWLDHQWGDQLSGLSATWDWFGLHLSDGSELMAYRVRDREGRVVQVLGSRVDPGGRAEALEVEFLPLEDWKSPSGRVYTLAWRLRAPELDLHLRPLFREGEILSRTTRVAYWEGPVVGEGWLNGRPVQARGMGEFVAGPWQP